MLLIVGPRAGKPRSILGKPRSILGPLLFLIYINDLPNNLLSKVKLFADDTSIFSNLFNPNISSLQMNRDLRTIAEWAYQWKMTFNPDPSKQAVEVLFSTKKSPSELPPLFFNNNIVTRVESHKHLGLILDSKLSFGDHLKEKISKTNKIIGTLKRLRKFLPRRCLVHIYKAFARPLLDYGDLIYDNPGNASFSSKLESIQYNAMLAISGAIRGTSREKLYQEIGIESLEDRRWLRRLCLFYKIINNNTPSYLHDLVKKQIPNYSFRSFSVHSYTSRTKRFQNSFFSYCSKQWDELDDKIQNSPSVFSLKKSLLQFIRPSPCSIFWCSQSLWCDIIN